ncbi:MAG TPA: OmpA family protein [Candidatus Cloacimonadota bacterium]|nr:OmpA family protein [Candidatus Cloacimonadota bacterium]HPT71197.1 OmpA family protein [Candidatus Cloacimonadota bacterium]
MKRIRFKSVLLFLIIISIASLLAAKAPKVKDSDIIQQQREEMNRMTDMQAQSVDMIKSILVERRDDLKRKIGLFREDMGLKYENEILPEEERIMYYKMQKELASSKISLAKTNQLLSAFGVNDEQPIQDNPIDTTELRSVAQQSTTPKQAAPEETVVQTPKAEPKAEVISEPEVVKVNKQVYTSDESVPSFIMTGNVTKFHENVLFASGSVQLDQAAKNVLNYFIQNFADLDDDYMVQIVGHTDNLPIGGNLRNKYHSNWNLSVARSIVVAEYLTKVGKIDPRRLIVSGQGEYHPVASNATEAGRKQNRRVELMTGSK